MSDPDAEARRIAYAAPEPRGSTHGRLRSASADVEAQCRRYSGLLLAAVVFGFLLTLVFGNEPSPVSAPPGAHQLIGLGPFPLLLLLALIIVYFVLLGRAGGTVFQHLFDMKRAR
jgi:hypothetical protein